ncbi:MULTISPECIES: flavin reductase family protein [unclassified Streptomyces]|uniref:flavin reductase family protein n=1 Tax=unclassified Streptomyces TaxID=2593676 RepID=UPI002E298181|nr:flavin reductase family protein [Streptomyces sp. NBC_00223]
MSPEQGVTPAAMREAMRLLPTAVAVVSAGQDGTPYGLTVGSFFSLSLDPPMIGFGVRAQSVSWPRIAALGRFRVNVLNASQAAVSAAMARSGSAKFQAVDWTWSARGNPAVTGALLGVECALDRVLAAGDHVLVTARVEEMDVVAPDLPLVWFQRGYRTLERRA